MVFSRFDKGNLKKIELAVTFVLIFVFIRVVIDAIWELRVQAEKTHVEWMVGTLNSAIGMEIARRAISGGIEALALLDGSNPMDLLEKKPDNYFGTFDEVDLEHFSIPEGSWYFDMVQRVLYYKVSQNDDFRTTFQSQPPRIRFSLRTKISAQGVSERLGGIGLVKLDDFSWVIDD